jgi:Zn-dependent oligopeptidase
MNKNMAILDSMIAKRHGLAVLMGHKTFASYVLQSNMAKDPATVWAFLNDLKKRVKPKAIKDVALLKAFEKSDAGPNSMNGLQPWDLSYYSNQLRKKLFGTEKEKISAYLPMKQCLKGMFDIYEKLLGFTFKKITNASVWHEDVEMYEVYEGEKLKGRFYLDLYPRLHKEGDFYETTISSGKAIAGSHEIPVALLVGNFTSATKTQPSLLTFGELTTLFHEFGHIVNAMSYEGEFAFQSDAKDDFVEAMSQIFENWIWDYDVLASFARHYKTGEVLPKELFNNMLNAKNLLSGFNTIRSLRYCLYDMNLYDKYDPARPVSTDKIWQDIDKEIGVMPLYVQNTHPQASWTHINTNPVYYYGYVWSQVYAQDMFTQFQKDGLTDTNTGMRYRNLILANGIQRDIEKAVEEFLGRPSNNEAYIRSLGLE